ncbi:MAG: hypothetical protein KAR38_06880, partial [Calditrichia bacterium]|nr:hypothetical protein [Calditrichia bacterium]
LRGNNQFRFNASYMSVKKINKAALAINKIASQLNMDLQLIVDIPGIKRRIGTIAGEWMVLKPNTIIHFELGKEKTNDRKVIPIPEKDFFDMLEIGDRIQIKDGKIEFLVKSLIYDKKIVEAQSLSATRLKSFYGYNLYLKNLRSLGFPEKNWKILSELNYNFITHIAVSYTESAQMLQSVKQHLKNIGATTKIIAKIEDKEGFDNIKEIDKETNILWFCRGDFGNNTSLLDIYKYEKEILAKIPQFTSPLYVAGENFMGIVNEGLPSRAEIAHAGYLFANGIKGMILSDEIVNSKQPVNVYLLANKIKKKYSKFIPGQVINE